MTYSSPMHSWDGEGSNFSVGLEVMLVLLQLFTFYRIFKFSFSPIGVSEVPFYYTLSKKKIEKSIIVFHLFLIIQLSEKKLNTIDNFSKIKKQL